MIALHSGSRQTLNLLKGLDIDYNERPVARLSSRLLILL